MTTENTTYTALNLNKQMMKSIRRALAHCKELAKSVRNVAEYRALENRIDRVINAVPTLETEYTTPVTFACNVTEAKVVRRALWQEALRSVTAPTVDEYMSIAKRVDAALAS